MTKRILMLWGVCVVFALQPNAPAQSITNQPQSITVNNASTATFTVGATGATTYQWQFNGTNLSDTATNQSVPGSISGSQTSTLTLENVASNEAGSYTVVVNGAVTSSPPAVLNIVPGTIVTFQFSGIIGTGTTNMQVQLFDHDKPVTVANFLHYIRSGAYSNMFMERLDQGVHVLQGGSYAASNRTDTTPPIYGWDVYSLFTLSTTENPPFPPQILSEFYNGPIVRNDFGTISMALEAEETIFGPVALTNTARNAFFFNLADNSGSPDVFDTTTNGPFTTFGRVINGGTNVLNYFNSLSDGNGIETNADFIDQGTNIAQAPGFPVFTTLPVNGTNVGANANLVYCDFSVTTNIPVDTTSPTVTITSPAANALVTNGPVVQGTAGDNVGVALVTCVLTPANVDGGLPNGGVAITNFATGTTNWSLTFSDYDPIEQSTLDENGDVLPGTYTLSAISQDGAGNRSGSANEAVTVTAIITNGVGTVIFTNSGFNPIGFPFQEDGSTNVVEAVPGTNQLFLNWSAEDVTADTPLVTFVMNDGLVLTANFISNGIPGGIAFTSPPTNAVLSGQPFTVTGTFSNGLPGPVTVSCTIYSQATGFDATPTFTNSGTTNWSVSVTNFLSVGAYTIQAEATDALGRSTVISENFTVTNTVLAPVITSPAPGVVVPDGGSVLIQGTAAAVEPFTVAAVTCYLIPITETNGVAPNGGFYESFTASGSNNWSLQLTNLGPPGRYTLAVQVEDNAGNFSTLAEQPFTITGILIDGNGAVTLTQDGVTLPNPVGYPLQNVGTYVVDATPAAGQTFVNWTYGDFVTESPVLDVNYGGGVLTATFVATNYPRGSKGIAFTYPAPNSTLTTNSFMLKGTIVSSVRTANINCQIFSASTGLQSGPTLSTVGTRTWEVPVSDLAPDYYEVEAVATNATGFGTVISEKFAVFAFKGVTGTYNGLFLCTNAPISPTNSGFFTFTLYPTGGMTGKFLFPGYKPFTFEAFFYAYGNVGFGISGFPDNPIDVSLTLDLTNGTDTLTGIVESASNSWVSPLLCYREVTKLTLETTPATGKYMLDLPLGSATNNPQTNGYAAVSVSGLGNMAVSGALPDGAPFSQSVGVSKGGVWPLYAVPTGYKTNGMILGWETNQSSGNVTGRPYWHKNTGVGAYYTTGVATNISSAGTNYLHPRAGNYSIVFQGGAISAPITNSLTVNNAGQFVVPRPAPADKLAISVSANGIIGGTVVIPGVTKPVQFKGGYFGASAGGSGFVLEGDGQTGTFSVRAQ